MIKEKLNKKCLNCDVIFYKKENESMDDWVNRHKFCSRSCSAKYRNIGCLTRFKIGQPSVLKGTKGVVKPNSGSFKKGMKISEETHQKMLGRIPWNKGKKFLQVHGENHPNWKGGITPLYRAIRGLLEMKIWVRFCMKRDNFTCQKCGRKRCRGDRVILDVHHIISFKETIIKNNVKTLDEAVKCKELWDPNNGKTICRECHNKTKGSNQYKV